MSFLDMDERIRFGGGDYIMPYVPYVPYVPAPMALPPAVPYHTTETCVISWEPIMEGMAYVMCQQCKKCIIHNVAIDWLSSGANIACPHCRMQPWIYNHYIQIM